MLAPLLVLLALHAQDPVQVRARLTDETIRAGETTILRVDVETEGDRAQIQRFTTLPPGVELVGTRDYDQRQFSLPGGMRRFISREFVLRARAEGRYRIPAVDVVVDGRSYTTGTTLLTVSAAPSAPRGQGRGSPAAAPQGVMLRAWLDADTVFVGEQVTLQVEALFSQDARLRLRRAPEYQPPSPSGFWVHDLNDSRSPTSRLVGNEMYEVQTFRRAFFPLAEGQYKIPPATLQYEMRRGLLYAPETFDAESDPLPLTVLPVPEAGRPPAYTGAVGRYSARAWVEPEAVPAGEAAVLTVEVEGTGNVKALPAPQLSTIEGVEVFPPSEEAETEVDGTTFQGRKRFSWVLIPREPGALSLPSVRYAYFDPESARFETAATEPLSLAVEPGAAPSDATASDAAALRYLKTRPKRGDALGFVRSPWFLAAQLIPLLLLAAALVRLRVRARAGGRSRAALRRDRIAELRALELRSAQADPDLFADAERFARSWLAERLGLNEREAGRASALTAVGVPEATAASVSGILERLAAARYAPAPPPPETRRDLLLALGRVLDRVDDEAPAPRPRSTAGAALLVLLLPGLVLAGLPAAAGAQAGGAFAEGLRRFDAGDYRDAATAFDRYIGGNPADPAGWYNLGTAYHRAGYRGYATWAWLHVPALAPRDADTRHNLRAAGVAPELVARVAPAVPLRAEEAALLAGLAWLVAGVAGATWVLRRARPAALVGGVAVLLALAGAAAAWDSTRGTETLIVLDASTLRAGPNLQAESLAALEPGSGLIPLGRQGEWVRARTLRGAEGWVETRDTGSL